MKRRVSSAQKGKTYRLPLAGLKQAVHSWWSRCAGVLQQKTGLLSALQLKCSVALFCLLFTSYSSYIIYSSLQQEERLPVVTTQIRVVPLPQQRKNQPVISEREWQNMHRLLRYLDSLDAAGGALGDSLRAHHPHLRDTIYYLERIYKQQTKK